LRQRYINVFQKKYITKHALSLPGFTQGDEKLVNFFLQLREKVSGSNVISNKVVREMRQLFRDFGYHELDSAHHSVVNRYWEPFTKEMLDSGMRSSLFMSASNGSKCSRLVDSYITRTLWYVYWTHREEVKPLPNWKGVRQAVINTAVDILAADSAEKLEDMNCIRDLFLSDFYGKRCKIERSEEVSPIIKDVFSSSRNAWAFVLSGLENIRGGRMSSLGRTTALLVLAAAIDSKDIFCQEPLVGLLPQNTAHFEEVLIRFLDSQGSKLIKFAHM
jgi:hypothetical protein